MLSTCDAKQVLYLIADSSIMAAEGSSRAYTSIKCIDNHLAIALGLASCCDGKEKIKQQTCDEAEGEVGHDIRLLILQSRKGCLCKDVSAKRTFLIPQFLWLIMFRDRKLSIGDLSCKVCGQGHQCRTDALSQPIDVYSDWIDACDEVKDKGHISDAREAYDD